MLDGTYAVRLNTPMGSKNGTAVLRTSGDHLHARIDAPIIGRQEFTCTADGDRFWGEGSFKVLLLGTISFSGQGSVDGDILRATLTTNKGSFDISGRRVSHREDSPK